MFSIVRTAFSYKKFGDGMEVFGRRIFDDPNASPLDFWRIFLQFNLASLVGGGGISPV